MRTGSVVQFGWQHKIQSFVLLLMKSTVCKQELAEGQSGGLMNGRKLAFDVD